MKKIKWFVLIFSMVILSPLPAKGQVLYFLQEDEAVGKNFPEIVLKDLNGRNVNLTEYRSGKRSIIFFWATWCPHCREALQRLNQRGTQEFDAKNIKFILIDTGEKKKLVKSYMDRNNISMEMLLDEDSKLAEDLGIVGLPTFVFVDEKGVIKEFGHSLPGNYEELFTH